MSGIEAFQERAYQRISAKYWDYPAESDEMRILSYDAGDNPLIVAYYRKGTEMFRHELEYDVSGRIIVKKLIRK